MGVVEGVFDHCDGSMKFFEGMASFQSTFFLIREDSRRQTTDMKLRPCSVFSEEETLVSRTSHRIAR